MSKILVELQDTMGSDRSIANSAWTSSFDKAKRDAKTDAQVEDIVRRLAKDGHAVPFESVIFRFWIRMPIFTDRQHMTHRIASHSGLSGRYRTMPTDYYNIPDDVNKIISKLNTSILEAYKKSCEIATKNYELSIVWLKSEEKLGVITNDEFKRCREVLRGQLPLSSFTERTTIINLRSFANYMQLRNKPSAQKEIQEVAEKMLEEVKKQNCCPIAINALESNKWEL